jgi:hypothetical protein
MVTFGHHFENGCSKNASKAVKKMSKKSLFEEEQQKIKIIICYTEKN